MPKNWKFFYYRGFLARCFVGLESRLAKDTELFRSARRWLLVQYFISSALAKLVYDLLLIRWARKGLPESLVKEVREKEVLTGPTCDACCWETVGKSTKNLGSITVACLKVTSVFPKVDHDVKTF